MRFLLYSCDVQVEGLLTGFGHGHYENTRPDLLRKAVAAYGEVVGDLLQHRRSALTSLRALTLCRPEGRC